MRVPADRVSPTRNQSGVNTVTAIRSRRRRSVFSARRRFRLASETMPGSRSSEPELPHLGAKSVAIRMAARNA